LFIRLAALVSAGFAVGVDAPASEKAMIEAMTSVEIEKSELKTGGGLLRIGLLRLGAA